MVVAAVPIGVGLGADHEARARGELIVEADLTPYDEWNVLLSFERLADGTPWFLDFKIYERT